MVQNLLRSSLPYCKGTRSHKISQVRAPCWETGKAIADGGVSGLRWGLKISIQTATSAIQNPKYTSLLDQQKLYGKLYLNDSKLRPDRCLHLLISQYFLITPNRFNRWYNSILYIKYKKKVLYTYMVYTCCICIPTYMATPPALTGLNAQGVHLPESCLQALDRRLAVMELHGTQVKSNGKYPLEIKDGNGTLPFR